MKKVMFVTVGTSLFHSASWEASTEVLRDVAGYDQWTSEQLLREPEARKKSPAGARIQDRLEFVLNVDNAAAWAERLAGDLLSGETDFTTVMRYSAELATILKLYQEEARSETLPEFLRSYTHIYLPCDTSAQGAAPLAYVAANHLAAYLNRLAEANGMLAKIMPIPGLSSIVQDELLGTNTGLGLLADRLVGETEAADQVDFVISGGYKLYGVFLYPLLETKKARLLYIYEGGGWLLKVSEPAHGAQQPGTARPRAKRMRGVFQ